MSRRWLLQVNAGYPSLLLKFCVESMWSTVGRGAECTLVASLCNLNSLRRVCGAKPLNYLFRGPGPPSFLARPVCMQVGLSLPASVTSRGRSEIQIAVAFYMQVSFIRVSTGLRTNKK